jgi:hypothetical protein
MDVMLQFEAYVIMDEGYIDSEIHTKVGMN